MSTWMPIITAALVLVDLIAHKLHRDKFAAYVEKVEGMLGGGK